MKVLVGHFTTESNGNIPSLNNITNYDLVFGDKVIDKMQIREAFQSYGIEIIPSVYAGGGPSGVIDRETFNYIESCFLRSVREHLHEIDGIYLWLHGASEVDGLGSGDHHILKEIRKIVGPYLPITVSCDPHGNLCKEYVESTQAIRSFRESPHTDMKETYQRVAKMLCEILTNRVHVHSVYRKLPLILGGEQSVSADEPVKSINTYMDELEKDPRIMSCSWHVGYIRHDTPVAGCGIVVVPSTEEDQEYAEETADKLAKYVWDKRHEFHYTGVTAKPDEALEMAIKAENKPAVITDSGDNTTSGATGWNTYVLRQFLNKKDYHGTALFASICDVKTCNQLLPMTDGEKAKINLGTDYDEMSRAVELEVVIKSHGEVYRPHVIGSGVFESVGNCVTVNIINTNIDIVITDHRQAYCCDYQFEQAGVVWTKYDVVVVKQGYIFPELKKQAGFYVMSLTDGATPQDTASIPFKLVQRPMYPIDNI